VQTLDVEPVRSLAVAADQAARSADPRRISTAELPRGLNVLDLKGPNREEPFRKHSARWEVRRRKIDARELSDLIAFTEMVHSKRAIVA
jgi:hypothetical protein